ncbi:hypothetical protein swp_4673 [Shewanella piezotolerans WP3]|uniref:Uncharacterized protein n=1 Tax=Shewanella piezotolerans (strain WP3 / JCM 13877) TaxID=225849 RepID=B8CTR6_SHEPW|nr:hypothetical protein swp_4673 [Shewanella piezotolerans WP3]
MAIQAQTTEKPNEASKPFLLSAEAPKVLTVIKNELHTSFIEASLPLI